MSTGSAVSGYKVYERVVHGLSEVSDMFESGGVSEDVLEHFLDPLETDMVIDTLVHDGRGSTTAGATLSGLSGGVMHEYVVGCVSLAGEGERSGAVLVSTSPLSVDGVVSVSQTTSGIELEWDVPAVSSGSAVSGYIVYMDDGAGGDVDSVVTCGDGCLLYTSPSPRD